MKRQHCPFGLNLLDCLCLAFWQSFSLKNFAGQVPPAESSAGGGCPVEMETSAKRGGGCAPSRGQPPIFRGSVEPCRYLITAVLPNKESVLPFNMNLKFEFEQLKTEALVPLARKAVRGSLGMSEISQAMQSKPRWS